MSKERDREERLARIEKEKAEESVGGSQKPKWDNDDRPLNFGSVKEDKPKDEQPWDNDVRPI